MKGEIHDKGDAAYHARFAPAPAGDAPLPNDDAWDDRWPDAPAAPTDSGPPSEGDQLREAVDMWRAQWREAQAIIDRLAANHQAESDMLRARVERAEALLREMIHSGVVMDDARLLYLEIQVDRVTWDAARAYFEEKGASDDGGL